MANLLNSNCTNCPDSGAGSLLAMLQRQISIDQGTNYARILWVDENGNDATGEKGNFHAPYRTCAGAEADAVAGDTIQFMPGTHLFSQNGKDGITYWFSPGATIQNNGYTNCFRDAGTAISYDILGFGDVLITEARFIYNTNGSSVTNVTLNNFTQTNQFANLDPIVNYGEMSINVYGNVNTNVQDWYFLQTYQGSKTYFQGNRVECRTMVFMNRGELYFRGNYLRTYSSDAYEQSFGSADLNAYARVEFNYCRIDNGGGVWTGGVAPSSGTVEFEGCTFAGTCDTRPFIDIGDVSNSGGVAIFNNCTFNVEASANLPVAIIRSNVNNFLAMRNCTLINHNTGSISGGIQIENNVPTGSLELTNVVIKLNSTAVAAGAKAIRDNAGGNATYKLFTDIRSNGDFEGTNLISSTTGIVEPNVKSD